MPPSAVLRPELAPNPGNRAWRGLRDQPRDTDSHIIARRKAADQQERRTDFIGSKVTPSERAEIERRAAHAGRRLSDFLRQVALSNQPGAAVEPKLPAEVGRQIAVELARVGTNLNQLAYHANATRSMPARDALDATLDEIVKATEALTRL